MLLFGCNSADLFPPFLVFSVVSFISSSAGFSPFALLLLFLYSRVSLVSFGSCDIPIAVPWLLSL
jgi:hypothetical protein